MPVKAERRCIIATYAAKLRQENGSKKIAMDSDGALISENPDGTTSENVLTDGVLQVVTVEVTSAEILALNATPKTIVAAQGAGKTIEFVSAVLFLDYNSAAYANNGILSFYETDASGTAVSDAVPLADFLDETADTYQAVQALSANTALNDNVPIVFSMATGESITGDSPVTVKATYRVHDFS